MLNLPPCPELEYPAFCQAVHFWLVLVETVLHLQVGWESFDAMRRRVRDEWRRQPPNAEVISQELQTKTAQTIQHLNEESPLTH